MPRYDDRYGGTRLYVGHLSSRTRSRDLERLFSRYGRVRDVDMKRDYAFVEFSDPRDADDARYSLNGREFDGGRIIVEVAKGVPRGSRDPRDSRDSRDYMGRGPAPGSGRCFNCGIDGHWARDCKAGDWKNKCYRCGERGHIERSCQNSPKKLLRRGRSYSRSPVRSRSPRRGRSRSASYSRSRSVSRSHSPVRKERVEKRPRSYSRSPEANSPPPSKTRRRSPTPEEEEEDLRKEGSPSPKRREYSESPRAASPSPDRDHKQESPEAAPAARRSESPAEANGRSPSISPRRPVEDDEEENHYSEG